MSVEHSVRTDLLQNRPEILSVSQLCEILAISDRTAYRLLASKTIRYFRIGRKYCIPKVFVLDFIEAQMQELTV